MAVFTLDFRQHAGAVVKLFSVYDVHEESPIGVARLYAPITHSYLYHVSILLHVPLDLYRRSAVRGGPEIKLPFRSSTVAH